MAQNDVSRQEWEAWRKVCELLILAGAVTGVDLDTPVNNKNPPDSGTPGVKLLNAIRRWGALNVKLYTEDVPGPPDYIPPPHI